MSQDTLSITLSALADPTRRAILDRLTRGPATVGELAAPFTMSGPAVSKHLRVLERAGLISQGREAQWRPCSLEASPLQEVAEYASGFRRHWEATYDRLDLYLRDLQSAAPAAPAAPEPESPHQTDPPTGLTGKPTSRRTRRGDHL